MEHEEQPKPVKNDYDPVWELVIDDMKKRDNVGRQRYGTPLQPFNGRDALRDAYEEALDLAVYLRQVIEEREFSNKHSLKKQQRRIPLYLEVKGILG